MPEFHDDWVDRLKADVRTLSADLDASIAREAATRQASLHAGDLYEQMRARAEAAELLAWRCRSALEACIAASGSRIGEACTCGACNAARAALSIDASSLHAELEAGRRDTARLDKVERFRDKVNTIEGPGCFPEDYWRIWGDPDDTWLGGFGKTLREAIDAAPEPPK